MPKRKPRATVEQPAPPVRPVTATENTALAVAWRLAGDRDVRIVITGPSSAEIVNRKTP